MHYFVTGATGFIGKRLVKKLLERKGAVVHFLLRPKRSRKTRPSAGAGLHGVMLRPCSGWMKLAQSSAT